MKEKKGETHQFGYRLYWERWERLGTHSSSSHSDQQHSDFVLLLICAPTHPGLHTWKKRAIENYFMCNLIILMSEKHM